MRSEQKDYIESKSADIGEKVTDQGITITLDSVTASDKSVYAVFHVEADPEQYDLSSCYGVAPIGMTADQGVWVENEAFGTVYASTGGGGSDLRSDGTGFWYHFTFDFDALPENARLNDGNTDMTIRIRRVVLDDNSEGATTEAPTVEGAWNYTFRLPESEASAVKTSDQTLEFANDLALTLHDIQVDEA